MNKKIPVIPNEAVRVALYKQTVVSIVDKVIQYQIKGGMVTPKDGYFSVTYAKDLIDNAFFDKE